MFQDFSETFITEEALLFTGNCFKLSKVIYSAVSSVHSWTSPSYVHCDRFKICAGFREHTEQFHPRGTNELIAYYCFVAHAHHWFPNKPFPTSCKRELMQITRKRFNKIHASYTLEGTVLENIESILGSLSQMICDVIHMSAILALRLIGHLAS